MKRILASLFVHAALMLPSPCNADESGDAIMKACPGLASWVARHHPSAGESVEQRDAHRQLLKPALRNELIARTAADQKARNAFMKSGMHDKSANEAMLAVDADNLAWLKAQVAAHGFPTTNQVGEIGTSDAFILVQHADRDPGFQAGVLKLMGAQVLPGVSKADIAMLTDRVLRAQGKPQRYGSQFMHKENGNWTMQPTEDIQQLARRRASMDLMPIGDYRCMMHVMYPSSTPTSKQAE